MTRLRLVPLSEAARRNLDRVNKTKQTTAAETRRTEQQQKQRGGK